MKIEHVAMWVKDLELMKTFYCQYFTMHNSVKYYNSNKNFSSYFLSFTDGGARIEIMHQPNMSKLEDKGIAYFGLAHLAISVGSREKVNELTEKLRSDNYIIISQPRVTGDGYYESVIEDPEGNIIEITE